MTEKAADDRLASAYLLLREALEDITRFSPWILPGFVSDFNDRRAHGRGFVESMTHDALPLTVGGMLRHDAGALPKFDESLEPYPEANTKVDGMAALTTM